jgi:hypothetical protein
MLLNQTIKTWIFEGRLINVAQSPILFTTVVLDPYAKEGTKHPSLPGLSNAYGRFVLKPQ